MLETEYNPIPFPESEASFLSVKPFFPISFNFCCSMPQPLSKTEIWTARADFERDLSHGLADPPGAAIADMQ